MEQRFPAGAEIEPVSYTQFRDHIGGYAGAIAAAVEQRASEQHYQESQIKSTVDYLKERSGLLRNGLKQDIDYSFLRPEVEHWFDMALAVTRSSNSLETSNSVIHKSLDAIQGLLIVNGVLTDEAKEQLKSKTANDPQ